MFLLQGKLGQEGWFQNQASWEAWIIWGSFLMMTGVILMLYIRKNRRMERKNQFVKQEAVELKINRPPAQHPMVDTSACIGCGSCVDACPEGGVLGLLAGKATIINGLRCVGHGKCAEACPVEALNIGLGDLSQREDIPTIGPDFQTTVEGLYIVGELGGLALVKNAIKQGADAIQAIAREAQPAHDRECHDIIVIGAGPAGLSAALAAKKAGLSCLILDQQGPGGTILQYPRKKMMLTQPVEIPLHGWLKKPQYQKEELLGIWENIIQKQQVQIETGVSLDNVVREGNRLQVVTSKGDYFAHRVILALGRRGTPRKLGAPGEEKPKVTYKLMDASAFQNEHLLVVGGGDSAVEAAIALARQKGNKVTLSYRKHKFFRIKKRNLEHLEQALAANLLDVQYNSNVTAIEDRLVHLKTENGPLEIANDYVFIFAGGIPPFGLLKKIGIGFGGT